MARKRNQKADTPPAAALAEQATPVTAATEKLNGLRKRQRQCLAEIERLGANLAEEIEHDQAEAVDSVLEGQPIKVNNEIKLIEQNIVALRRECEAIERGIEVVERELMRLQTEERQEICSALEPMYRTAVDRVVRAIGELTDAVASHDETVAALRREGVLAGLHRVHVVDTGMFMRAQEFAMPLARSFAKFIGEARLAGYLEDSDSPADRVAPVDERPAVPYVPRPGDPIEWNPAFWDGTLTEVPALPPVEYDESYWRSLPPENSVVIETPGER